MSRWLVRALAAGAVAAVIAALVGVGRPGPAHSDTTSASGGITVTGDGTVTAAPDRAGSSFGVTTQAATATAALAESSAAMEKVIAAVKAKGIPEADIQTQEVSLTPRTSDRGDIVGYTASNSVSVVSPIGKAGEVIDAAVAAGATDVFGPNLTRSDSSALYREALKAAVADAKAKAQALAAAAGVSLGSVTSIVETGAPTPIPQPVGRAETPSTPIQPGTERIEASVTVTFAIP